MKPAPLTDRYIWTLIPHSECNDITEVTTVARAIEAVRDQQWHEMLAKQEPVAWKWVVVENSPIQMRKGTKEGVYFEDPRTLSIPMNHPDYVWTLLYAAPPDHTAVMRQALEALQYFDDYVQPLTNKFGGPKVAQPASTSWHVHKAIAALKQALGEA